MKLVAFALVVVLAVGYGMAINAVRVDGAPCQGQVAHKSHSRITVMAPKF
jgi:hypothetical protein